MPDDPITELSAIIRKVGARVTLDPGRCITSPCIICRTTDAPRELVTIGTYTRRMGGNLLPGDSIVRPMCVRCKMLTEPP